MIFHAFLIKYAEIAIKGKNRYLFEDALVKQMKLALEPVEGEFTVTKEQGRVYVFCPEKYDFDEAVEALQRVFGIVGISPVVIYEDQGFDQMAKDVVSYMEARYPGYAGSFKVYTRRAKKSYPITSMEVSAGIGEKILDAFPKASVDVHHPEMTLSVEIRDKIYVYSETLPGPGGMPIGTNGKAPSFRRYRQPCCRIHDRKTWCQDRSRLFPRSAVHQRACKTESCRSCKTGSTLQRTDPSACGQFYGHPALYLRSVPT